MLKEEKKRTVGVKVVLFGKYLQWCFLFNQDWVFMVIIGHCPPLVWFFSPVSVQSTSFKTMKTGRLRKTFPLGLDGRNDPF